MKAHLVQIVQRLGHDAIAEAPLGSTRPDVTVIGKDLCFEVQQHRTSMSARTRRLLAQAHEVCWFVPNEAPERLRNNSFAHPAILFSVVRSDSDRRPATPWTDGQQAVVLVHGARRDIGIEDGKLVERGGGMINLETFVGELLRGERRWYDARNRECIECRRIHRSGWLRPTDHELAIRHSKPPEPARIEPAPIPASHVPAETPSPTVTRRRRWWWPFPRRR